MKKKFIILTLCFTLFFTSINYKKSYADGGIISIPILTTVVSLAVATGIALQGVDDIYDVGALFYNKYQNKWNEVQTIFNASVALNQATNQITVGKSFLDLVKEFFDDTFLKFDSVDTSSLNISYFMGIPVLDGFKSDVQRLVAEDIVFDLDTKSLGGLDVKYTGVNSNNNYRFEFFLNGVSLGSTGVYLNQRYKYGLVSAYGKYYLSLEREPYSSFNGALSLGVVSPYSLPYVPGSYVPGDVFEDDIGVWLPGNLGDLVGGGVVPGDIVGDVAPPWVGSGNPSVPNIDNPSIDVDYDTSFPVTGEGDITIPGDDIFTKVKEFIISLVVPNDAFWVDTFNDFRLNFGNAFPIIDMGKFNDLVVDGKPFPNIDINVMGIKGRVVNGDVINSIVDWLRPIVAGFMMLCLMFFNYRKIYKLIRNSEPFGGIAPGTSDFRTGISENNSYEIAQAKIRDTMFDIRNEFLSNKNKEGK